MKIALVSVFIVASCSANAWGPLALQFDSAQEQVTDKVYEPTEVSRKAKITFKPPAPYTEEARKHDIRGRVTLRLILRASGEVTDIEAIEGLPYGLTQECLKVARRIKFEPAIKDGQKVSQYSKAQYVFLGTL